MHYFLLGPGFLLSWFSFPSGPVLVHCPGPPPSPVLQLAPPAANHTVVSTSKPLCSSTSIV